MKYILIFFLALPVFILGQEVTGDKPSSPKSLTVSAGYATGVDINRDIWKSELHFSYDVYFIDELSGGPELSFVSFKGSRNGNPADALGISAAYVLKWFFVRTDFLSLYFEHGLGFAIFNKEFPPGGTRLNGNSFIGLGALLTTGKTTSLQLDTRLMHHSNGKGIVENNPAFDGVSFNIGYCFSF